MKSTTNPESFRSDLKQEFLLWGKGIALLFTSGFIPAVAAFTALVIIVL